MNKSTQTHFVLCLVALLLVPVTAAVAQQADQHQITRARIAVLAFRGIEQALSRWSATADYLERTIPNYSFEMVPLSLEEMKKVVTEGQVDFVLTNTGNYVELEANFGITRIATLQTPVSVQAGNVFGAVIFSRADRDDIKEIKDLAGKSFMAVKKNGFGGFQMAWRELKNHGIDPFTDFSRLEFSGFPQDKAAFAVLNGDIDAATFRTNTLENMANEGLIQIEDFRILNPRQHPGFPYAVSTRLYPEWPFARLKQTDQDLAQKVAISLLSMARNDPAALAGRYGGWTVPLDYQPVHELFRELRIGPYEDIGEITFSDLFGQYGLWLVLALVVLIMIVIWASWSGVLVTRRTRELSASNAELEHQIVVRRKAEEDAILRRAELAHIHRLNTMGEMASGFAHELNQPLSAIANFAKGCIRRINKGRAEPAELISALEQVAAQSTRAGEIIKRIRTFVRKEEPRRVRDDINRVIRETLKFIQSDADRQNARIELDLTDPLPEVEIDVVQVEQVILNLVRNAIEAMSGETDSPRT
ncbi:MAG TPA: sensor protein, partial [Rhodospirillales bacterium]|nr:sensor protein [Rhodospirillales bacterium]